MNRTNTKAVLHWNVLETRCLSHEARARLLERNATKINQMGELVLESQQHRSQHMNMNECLIRLEKMISAAMIRPKKRVATKPTKSSRHQRIQSKKKKGMTKKLRRNSNWDD